MFILNASVLNSSVLKSKPFTFRCSRCMPLLKSLDTSHASLIDRNEGRLSSNKDDSVLLLLPMQKETWNVKFPHLLQSLHKSLSKKDAANSFFYVPLDCI